MNQAPDPHLERFLPWLRVQARQFHLDARFQRRFGYSDLVSKTMQTALETIGQFRGGPDVQVMRWLQQILHSVFVELIRHNTAQKRDVRLEQHAHDAVGQSTARFERMFAAKESTPSERAERNERELRLAAALEQLPEEQRDVVILFHYAGKSRAEIAEQLRRTEKSVAGLLDRGRGRLRKLLVERGEC
jgi:RNA polymerase sigma-70 factor (ECF subfamily)